MDFIWESITDWLKEILISGIVSNLSGMFDSTNEQVGNIIGQVGMTPLRRLAGDRRHGLFHRHGKPR